MAKMYHAGAEARMILPKPLALPLQINHWKNPSVRKAYRPQRKPVTIAIGFAYDGGLLFCSDTKVTGDIHEFQSKLRHFRSTDGNCASTFASSAVDLTFPLSAISKCWEAVRGMDFAVRSIEEVHHAAEFSLAEFYSTHIYPHPDRVPDSPYLQLLIGIWLRGESNLYLSNETVLNPVDQYECIGAGAYLAKYIIGQYLAATPGVNSLQDVALIAEHAVQSAIEYDGRCGGCPEMLIVRDSGEIDISDPCIGYPSEKLIQGIFKETWRMLHDIAHMKNSFGKEVENRIDALSKEIRKLDLSKWQF